uniref:Mu-cyrtautoxin-As1a n=1 Tax=Apomastus schlingeri TaxID=12944 RepID=TXP3_APOSC|nr:RecName: Full=Mu-cyrtautoxin-As1a; Short=Mu-CUTX-As1a; AltName: Full=Aptotoxin III; Short=Aps III; AltName: Full=Aptotoxin-3; Short=Aps-3; AltName: Full=Paralytic peptide III; Short=PP III [Apomastus schlingeri]AAB24051.1 aptotoxin III, Aps III=insecticidal peptide [Aptostichus schlingeri=trap-door spiders, venom, Peptide, 37 aa] [Apomastus schlingeri]
CNSKGTPCTNADECCGGKCAYNVWNCIGGGCSKTCGY